VTEAAIAVHPNRTCQLVCQRSVGKGDKVLLGFSLAKGEFLMILDADLTVTPEELPRIHEALCLGKGEFINGARLVYPMEKQAMRFISLLGNKFFSVAFCWLLANRLKIRYAVPRCSGKKTMISLQPTVPTMATLILSAILTFCWRGKT
jgi:glycosyltransferase involved in cell wall biosynthesis